MSKLIGSVVVLIALVATASASTPVAGESVVYRYDSTHSYVATVALVEGDGSCDLVVYAWYPYNWPFGPSSQAAYATIYVAGVVEGLTDNRWTPNPNIGLGEQGPAGAGAAVTGQSTPTLAINGSAAQFDATHDTEYTASVKITTTLTLTGGAAGHVDLACDASATPTTIVETVQSESTGTLTVGLNLQSSNTLVLHWRVPAGHRCKLTSTNDTGTPTYSVVRQLLQTLG